MQRQSISVIVVPFVALLTFMGAMEARSQQNVEDLLGTWAATLGTVGDREPGITAVELHIATTDAQSATGTLCFTRDDGAMEFLDFGQDLDIVIGGAQDQSQCSGFGYSDWPRYIRWKAVHTLNVTDDPSLLSLVGSLRGQEYSGVNLTRGPNQYGCLQRVLDFDAQTAPSASGVGIGNCGKNLRTCRVGGSYWCCNKGKSCDYDNYGCK